LVSGWLSPVLFGVSLLLLGRSFYILYVQQRGTRTSAVITWMAAAVVIGFWTWRFV
jgi:hypothetical protein